MQCHCTDLSSGVDQSQHLVGPIRGVMRWEEGSASGVDWPRALTGLKRRLGSDQEVLASEWCHLPIPTGMNDRGGGSTIGGGTVGGGTVGGDTVGAWRPRASVSQRVNTRRERWFSSHIPSTSRERPNSRSICAWGVGTRQYTPPLESH